MASPEDEKKPELDPKEQRSENDVLEQSETVTADDMIVEQVLDQVSVDDGEALANALAEVEKFKDLALRSEAEMQNLQRRTARDIENAHKFGVEKFVLNMLPVVDSLEKAIEAIGENQDPIAEGVKLCRKLMIDTLSKEGVEIIDPSGEPFDPNEHQAMSMVENPDMEPNSVLAVVQKGCKLNGRLVRPAMVMVTKSATDQPVENPSSDPKD
jgi:molecular chaperone GrpE